MTGESEEINLETLPDSMWQMKPWWCQPWTIVTTGLAVSLCSWLLLHRLWITLPVSSGVAVWWLLFLIIVPAQYSQAIRAAKTE